jgi:hypothetical protein
MRRLASNTLLVFRVNQNPSPLLPKWIFDGGFWELEIKAIRTESIGYTSALNKIHDRPYISYAQIHINFALILVHQYVVAFEYTGGKGN